MHFQKVVNFVKRRSDIALSILAIWTCLACFSPPTYLSLNSSENSNDGEIPLVSALHAVSLQICVVSCIGALIPITLDFLLDFFVLSTRYLHRTKSAIWLLLLSTLGTNVFIYMYIIPSDKISYWTCTICCHILFLFMSGFSILNAYGSQIWKWKFLSPIVFILCLVAIKRSFKPFLSPNTWKFLDIADSLFVSIAYFIFMCLCLKWIYFIVLKSRKLIRISMDDIYCTLNLVILTVAITSQFLSNQSQSDISSLNVNVQDITRYLYSFAAYTVIVGLLNGRYIRAKIVIIHAEKEAETKRMLTGFFSHELRTPLNSVLMGLQILQRDLLPSSTVDNEEEEVNTSTNTSIDPDPIRSLVDELYCSCESAVDVLNDVLVYQSLEQNELIITKKNTAAIPLLRAKIKKITTQHRMKDFQLVINLPEGQINGHDVDMLTIAIDVDKFIQVLRTLLSNAIDVTPCGDIVTVDVTMTMNDKSEHLIQIYVRDKGPRISREDQLKIFDSALNFTAGTVNAREEKGLGLWIAHKLVALHNGQLSVKSEELSDSCNTFTISLPLLLPADVTAASTTFSTSITPISPVSTRSVFIRRLLDVSISHLGVMPFGYNTAAASIHTQNEYQSHANISEVIMSSSLSSSLLEMANNNTSNHNTSNNINALHVTGTTSDDIETGIPPNHNSHHNHHRDIAVVHSDDMSSNGNGAQGRRRLTTSTIDGFINGAAGMIGTNVLVVDDDLINRKILSRLLMGHCDSTVLAEDGAVAVEKMKAALTEGPPFDLVLMDYQMPNMDGPTSAKNMRAMGYKGIIIGVTGNTLPIHVQTFMTHGADEVLHKPINFERLARVVANTNQ